jgi:hypothetical protein
MHRNLQGISVAKTRGTVIAGHPQRRKGTKVLIGIEARPS